MTDTCPPHSRMNMEDRQCMFYEFKKLCLRREIYILLCICVFFASVAFLEEVVKNAGTPCALLPSALEAGMLWESGIGSVYIYIMPFIASACYVDSYFTELGSQYIAIDITRSGKKYFTRKYVVVLIAGFFVSMLAPLINLLLCNVAFPIRMPRAVETGSVYTISIEREMQWVLFPQLYISRPSMYAFLHICLLGIMGGLISGLSYCFSLFYRKNIVITIGSGGILYLILTMSASVFGKFSLAPFHYFLLRPSGYTKSITIFIIMNGLILFASIVLLMLKEITYKDILSE